MGAIAERYRSVLRKVDDAADCVGRDASDIKVLAISKHVGPEEIEQAIKVGIRRFGENRAQEFADKQALFPHVEWHFVGTLQTNKVRLVVGKASLIHSVDSVKLLKEIDRRANEMGIEQSVLLEVNVSGEESKHGFPPHRVEEVLETSVGLENVRVSGLMTMAPLGSAEAARPVFRGLARLFASLAAMRFNGTELEELSMGMTNDYTVAIEEGATIVRVGRAIFGR